MVVVDENIFPSINGRSGERYGAGGVGVGSRCSGQRRNGFFGVEFRFSVRGACALTCARCIFVELRDWVPIFFSILTWCGDEFSGGTMVV